MLKLLYDVPNGKWYNENGDAFASDAPVIPFGNSERVVIQLYAEANSANSGSEVVAGWTKYTEFDGMEGLGAILATDNNFLHWFRTSLQTALEAGTIPEGTAIDIAMPSGATLDDIAENGNFHCVHVCKGIGR